MIKQFVFDKESRCTEYVHMQEACDNGVTREISYLPSCEVHQHVIQMSVSQANDVTNHRHDSSGTSIALSHLPPLCSTCARTP